MADQTETDLDYLRWHWGDAFVITRVAGGIWKAERKDTHKVIRAKSAVALLDKIRDEYSAKPVPRQEPPVIETDNVIRKFTG